MIAWQGGRQRVTNEPAKSPAPVMDGLGGVWRGGSGVGGSHQDKYFLLLEPSQAGGGPGDWGDVSTKGLGSRQGSEGQRQESRNPGQRRG